MPLKVEKVIMTTIILDAVKYLETHDLKVRYDEELRVR